MHKQLVRHVSCQTKGTSILNCRSKNMINLSRKTQNGYVFDIVFSSYLLTDICNYDDKYFTKLVKNRKNPKSVKCRYLRITYSISMTLYLEIYLIWPSYKLEMDTPN